MDVHVFPCPAHTDTLLTFQQTSLSFENTKSHRLDSFFPTLNSKVHQFEEGNQGVADGGELIFGVRALVSTCLSTAQSAELPQTGSC